MCAPWLVTLSYHLNKTGKEISCVHSTNSVKHQAYTLRRSAREIKHILLNIKFLRPSLRTVRFSGLQRCVCLPPASCWFLAWLTLRPRRWRRFVPPKRQYISTELQNVINLDNRTRLEKHFIAIESSIHLILWHDS